MIPAWSPTAKTFTIDDSRVVPHRSTESTHWCLISQIGRDVMASPGYERMMGVACSGRPSPCQPEGSCSQKGCLLQGSNLRIVSDT